MTAMSWPWAVTLCVGGWVASCCLVIGAMNWAVNRAQRKRGWRP